MSQNYGIVALTEDEYEIFQGRTDYVKAQRRYEEWQGKDFPKLLKLISLVRAMQKGKPRSHFTSNYNSLTWNEISLCRKKRFWQPLFPIKQNPGNKIRMQYQKVCDVLKHNKRMLVHFPLDFECTNCLKDTDPHDTILGKAATIQNMPCCALLAHVSCKLKNVATRYPSCPTCATPL